MAARSYTFKTALEGWIDANGVKIKILAQALAALIPHSPHGNSAPTKESVEAEIKRWLSGKASPNASYRWALAKFTGAESDNWFGETASADADYAGERPISSASSPLPAQRELVPTRSETYKNDDDDDNETVLVPEYPSDYATTLANARTLWMSGFDLRRIIDNDTHMNALKKILDKPHGRVKALLLDPDSPACRYAAMQNWGSAAVRQHENYIHRLRYSFEELTRMRGQKSRNIFQIKTIDYPLPFGLDIVNAEPPSSDGIIYVRYYPFYRSRGGWKEPDQPILVLTPAHEEWYECYKDQFTLMWDDKVLAKPWPRPKIKQKQKKGK